MAGPRRTIDSYFRPVTGAAAAAAAAAASTSSHAYRNQQTGSSRGDRTQRQRRRTRPEDEDAAAEEEEEEEDDDDDRDTTDPFNLQRFLDAQDQLDRDTASPFWGTYSAALRQLHRGRKTSHWVWYVFPQMPIPRPSRYGTSGGGGTRTDRLSETSRFFGICSLAEARAYLDHEVLGKRLVEITGVVLESKVESAEELMGGETDRDKLLSCMTLFARAADADADADAAGASVLDSDGQGEGGGHDKEKTKEKEQGEIAYGKDQQKHVHNDGSDEGDTRNELKKQNIFSAVLDKYFDGQVDVLTERALDAGRCNDE